MLAGRARVLPAGEASCAAFEPKKRVDKKKFFRAVSFRRKEGAVMEKELTDSKTVAAYFGMTSRRVQQLTKEGILTAVRCGNANRYDLQAVVREYVRYLTDKASGRETSQKDANAETRRLEAEADFKRSRADMAALQLQELEGTMHRSEDVEAVKRDLVITIRSMP